MTEGFGEGRLAQSILTTGKLIVFKSHTNRIFTSFPTDRIDCTSLHQTTESFSFIIVVGTGYHQETGTN